MKLQSAQLLNASVFHKRMAPVTHGFRYPVFFLSLPLNHLDQMESNWRFGINRRAIVSIQNRDHGARDGSALLPWLRAQLQSQGLEEMDGDVVLLTMPRILGYLFNPVSFWFCHDRHGVLRAVLAEVNNTYGETHSYLCVSSTPEGITSADWMSTQKVFHVSPFFETEGEYQFHFDVQPQRLKVQIDYSDCEGNKQLYTSVEGALVDLNPATLRRAFWTHPLQTFVVIGRIHWHALRLFLKRLTFIPKPEQIDTHLSVAPITPHSSTSRSGTSNRSIGDKA